MEWIFTKRKGKVKQEDENEVSSEECRGAVRATRSVLAYSSDPEIKRPLLAESSGGLKRRKGSTSADYMGTEVEKMETSLSDLGVVPVGPNQRLSHSLPIVRETFYSIISEIILPFFIAGFGMAFAGIYFDKVQEWRVFKDVGGFVVLVPALLGLKGNLEMTLASRLSTEANLGNMDTKKEQWSMVSANLILVQCQAVVVGLSSSIVAVIIGALKHHDRQINWTHALVLVASSTFTASAASCVLGIVTVLVVLLSKKLHVNPDNIATPIAGSLGDITALALLSITADFLYRISDEMLYLSVGVIVLYIAVTPLLFCISKNNKYTKAVLYSGWTPVVIAMLISTLGGVILDKMVKAHKGVAVFQPVINGVGGNLVSIQASRLSTALHQQSELGTLPEHQKVWISPVEAFFSDTAHALTARVLMSLVIPGHITFAYFISFIKNSGQSLSFMFISNYIVAAAMQVAILLYIAYILTHQFWKLKINPDNSTIPYLTAIGDVLGIILLGLTFEFLNIIGQPMEH